MSSVSPGQERSCTFCRKTLRDVEKLILSPDKQTGICDERALEPARLNLVVEKSGGEQITAPHFVFLDPQIPSELLGWSASKKISLLVLREEGACIQCLCFSFPEKQAQICKDCLAACRQILVQEFKQDSATAVSK